MKKNLLLSLLVLFVLSTATFAGVTDPKKDSDKNPAKNAKENKLSDEEISRLNRKVEGKYNMDNSTVSNTLKKNANSKQVYVESEGRHHGGYIWYGGGALLLIVILVIILV